MSYAILTCCILQTSALRFVHVNRLIKPTPADPHQKGKYLPHGGMVDPTQEEQVTLVEKWENYMKAKGGKAHVLFVGDSTQRQLFDTHLLHVQPKVQGLTFDYYSNKNCPQAVKYDLSKQPDAIIYNFGLHLLHMWPAVETGFTCNTGDHTNGKHSFKATWGDAMQSDTQQEFVSESGKQLPPANCGKYSDMVSQATHIFRSGAPQSQLVYRSTNSICESKMTRAFADTLAKWKDPKQSADLEKNCRVACKSWFKDESRECGKEILSQDSLQKMYEKTQIALEKEPKVKLLDAFTLTQNRCDATRLEDGRHYQALDSQLSIHLAELLTNSL